ncbi:uncharacterized protein LOC123292965 [Chrysoperla carnea]|uniref:uncharacterized protein LOC123292965 n=1 Tax=Chrysoperla carnea TaxID=189513 RepID=UPI001D05FAD5|nr:uncharacterized protein LOC123292965 [Chrysoperla carnea]
MSETNDYRIRRSRELSRLRINRSRNAHREMLMTSNNNSDSGSNVQLNDCKALINEETTEENNYREARYVEEREETEAEPNSEISTYGELQRVTEGVDAEADSQSESNINLESESESEEIIHRSTDSDTEEDVDNEDEEYDDVNEIRKWALQNPPIPHARLEGLLKILQKKYPKLPKCAKTFLNTSSMPYDIEHFDSNSEFVYFGIEQHLQIIINPALHESNVIELLINVDGLPLFKSSSKQFWPILCKVFNDPDVYHPFPVAIYCGNEKPADPNKYLEKFIDEVNHLQANGTHVDDQFFHVKIKAFVADRPARAFLKCIIGHTGFYSCERCEIKGIRVKNRTTYPYSWVDGQPMFNDDERTDASFRAQNNPHHHNGVSPLINTNPPIDLINQFSLDSMHLVFLGVMKKLLEYWLEGTIKNVRLSHNAKTQLSNSLVSIQNQVPHDFQRSTRSLKDVKKFKATEYQFLLLYAGPIIFKNILREEIYTHFMFLHIACRLLWSTELATSRCSHAKYFLRKFVLWAPFFYGQECLISNMHALIHLADDVSYMNCPMSRINAYPFENMLGKIKRLLHHGNRPLSQFCRRWNEMLAVMKKPEKPKSIEILRKLHPKCASDDIIVKRIMFKNCIITSEFPNNIVLLKNGSESVLQIDRMFISGGDSENNIQISGKVLEKKGSLFTSPSNSGIMKMWRISRRNWYDKTCRFIDIKQKMILFAIHNGSREKLYVMPLLH